MKQRRDVERRLVEFLRKKGFPQEGLLPSPSLPAHRGKRPLRPDVLAIEPESGERLAVFEVRGQIAKRNLVNVVRELISYSDAVGDPSVEVLLAGESEDGDLVFHRLNDEDEIELLPEADFPSFKGLVAGKRIAKKQEIERKRETTTDDFKRLCFALGSFAGALLVGDFVASFWGLAVMTPERLILLGAAIGLFILPYAAKFKAVGIEWERYAKGSRTGSASGRKDE